MCGAGDFPPAETVRVRLPAVERAVGSLALRPHLQHIHVEIRSQRRVHAADDGQEAVEHTGERMDRVVVRHEAFAGRLGGAEREDPLDR